MFRVVPFALSVEKVRQLEKSTPAVLVALVTNYSYDSGQVAAAARHGRDGVGGREEGCQDWVKTKFLIVSCWTVD